MFQGGSCKKLWGQSPAYAGTWQRDAIRELSRRLLTIWGDVEVVRESPHLGRASENLRHGLRWAHQPAAVYTTDPLLITLLSW